MKLIRSKLQLEKEARLEPVSLRERRGFSLLELIVSLAIVGVVMAMLSNILINAVIISQKSIARSFIREEIAGISASVATDIRGADRITVCAGSGLEAECTMSTTQGVISWRGCDPDESGLLRICKYNEVTGEIIFSSTVRMNLDTLTFEQGFTQGSNQARTNILFSIVGSHTVTGTGVANVAQQTSLSTRNYILTLGGVVNPGVASGLCGNGTIDIGEVCDDGNDVDTDRCNNTCSAANLCNNLNKVFFFFPKNHNQNASLIAYRNLMQSLGYQITPAPGTGAPWNGTGTNTLPADLMTNYGHVVVFSGNNAALTAAQTQQLVNAIFPLRNFYLAGGKVTFIADDGGYATVANTLIAGLQVGLSCTGSSYGTGPITVKTNSSLAQYLPNPASFNTTSPCAIAVAANAVGECAMSNSVCHMGFVRRQNQSSPGSVAFFGSYFTTANSIAAMTAFAQYCAEDYPQMGAVN